MIETASSKVHSGLAYGHSWTPSSPSPLPFTHKSMDRQRWSIIWSWEYYTCTTPNIITHGITIFLIFSTATIRPFIALLSTSLFKWAWGFNCWPSLMSLFHTYPLKQTFPMLKQRLTKSPDSLKRFNTFTNKSMIFYRNPMLNTINAMINTGFHTSFRWVTKFGWIFKKSAS